MVKRFPQWRRDDAAHTPRHAANSLRARRRVLSLLLALVLAAPLAGVSGHAAYAADLAPAGTSIGGQSVAGMTRDEVADVVATRAASTTVSVTVAGQTVEVPLDQAGGRVDASSLADALVDGGDIAQSVSFALVDHAGAAPAVSVDAEAVAALAERINTQVGTPAVNASIQPSADGDAFEAVAGSDGRGVDLASLTAVVESAATTLTSQSTQLPLTDVAPSVSYAAAEAAAADADALIAPEVTVTGAGETIQADAATRASWVGTTAVDGELVAVLLKESVAAWVDQAAASVELDPISAIDNVDADGNLLEPARPAQAGLEVTNRDAVTDSIIAALEAHDSYSGELAVQEVEADAEQRVVSSGTDRFAYAAEADEKWIDINLTDSTITAYEGYEQVHGPVLMNHGGPGNETITGTYEVYLSYAKQDLGCSAGWSYCQKDVAWVTYWQGNYAIHSAPWAKYFGVGADAGSHGCINLPEDEAHWYYDWAETGTTVVSHY
ncbi:MULTISPECIES: L,D-transpeptidase family protein [unclassified Actinomyces]|uniref:L,D-transpeptidase family protein n=1 Tax=unclassified Actinomyces TaxID=2609248 RepID=UPI0013A6D308|nr:MULTISPECIES: L,D-transpeptidase family protein [unclassified Actinomyces]MBW3069081.1 L,D-transpeptidase family protein [Actinomyces sp. 594]NDR54233.1 L,D-transpeptidase family protein [Actinomyces sp. 565]